MRISLKTKLAAVVAPLVAVALAGTLTAPAAHADPAPQPPTGWKMITHQMSNTYLFPDNYTDNEGDAVQTWNADLVPDQGYKWRISHDSALAGAYRIRTNPHGRCLTAGSTATDYPRMKSCTGSTSQSWYIRRVPGTTDDWALIPYSYDSHALRPMAVTSNNVYVTPSRMWGGDPDLTQAWRLVDPPRGR